jgi:hypothetical protein
MTILGKILAVLNLLAAGAIIYFAAADWGARNSWAFNFFQMELALDGLPVDETQTDADGDKIVDKLTDKTMTDLFQPIGGFPVKDPKAEDKTQVAAVKRLQSTLWGQLNGLEEAARKERLVALLTPLARNRGEREALAEKIEKDPKATYDEAFAEALKPNNSQEAQRRSIAHVLLALNPEEKDRKWAATVVGLNAFAAEAGRQAQIFREMATQTRLAVGNEWDRYQKEQSRIIGELQALASAVDELEKELNRQNELVQKHNVLLQARISDVTELKAGIEKARGEARLALDQLANEQRLLFDAEQRVGNGIDQNLKLEGDIRKLEEAAPSGK